MVQLIVWTVALIAAIVTLRILLTSKTRRQMKKAVGLWESEDGNTCFAIYRKGCRTYIITEAEEHLLQSDNWLLFYREPEHTVFLHHNPVSDRITMMPGGIFIRKN